MLARCQFLRRPVFVARVRVFENCKRQRCSSLFVLKWNWWYFPGSGFVTDGRAFLIWQVNFKRRILTRDNRFRGGKGNCFLRISPAPQEILNHTFFIILTNIFTTSWTVSTDSEKLTNSGCLWVTDLLNCHYILLLLEHKIVKLCRLFQFNQNETCITDKWLDTKIFPYFIFSYIKVLKLKTMIFEGRSLGFICTKVS